MRKDRISAARGALSSALVAAGFLITACVPPPAPPPPPPRPAATTPPPPAVEQPPAPPPEGPPAAGTPREATFPAPRWDELANGLKVATIVSPALPIVQIRVAVPGGSAADGDRPGLSAMTAELLKEGGAAGLSGRDVLEKIEALGATLEIHVDLDRTVLSIGVTADQLAAALDLAGKVVKKPTMSPVDLARLRKRRVDAAADLARTDGLRGARQMLHRALFGGTPGHPYSAYDATAVDLAKITAADCRALHKKMFVPAGMFVVVAGDVAEDDVKVAVEKAFGDMPRGEAPGLAAPKVSPPSALSITLVDRPRSTQSQVLAGVLGPERASAEFPAFAVASRILGGGATGRLFLEVREKTTLSYSAYSDLVELARGPSVLTAYADTDTARTGLAVKALLEQIERLGTTEPPAAEVAAAARALSDAAALRLETAGALADELVRSRTLGLPDDAPSLFRRQVREVTAAAVAGAVAPHVRAAKVALVVSGDAKIVGPMLTRFGEVKVVDPAAGFVQKETLAKNPDAPLETGK